MPTIVYTGDAGLRVLDPPGGTRLEFTPGGPVEVTAKQATWIQEAAPDEFTVVGTPTREGSERPSKETK